MALTYGFYNSINHDRKYNADQMSAIFDQVLNDGIFANYGDHFAVTPATGMGIKIGPGRAWYNGTWTFNDSYHYLNIDESEVALDRIDAVVIEVDKNNRTNTLRVISGTPSSTPTGPILQNGDGVYQHPVAYVQIPAQTTAITPSMITNVAGTTLAPFVTSILQSTDISVLWSQWGAEFNEWFEALQNELDENQAANLQRQINELKILTGTEDPNYETIGKLGQFYLNTRTYMLFRCADMSSGTYFWVPMSARTIIGVPTNSTSGFVGEFCMDLVTHYMYKCIASDTTTGTYEWEPIGDHHVGDVIHTVRTDLGPKYGYVQNGAQINIESTLGPDLAALTTSFSYGKLSATPPTPYDTNHNYELGLIPNYQIDDYYIIATCPVSIVHHSGNYYSYTPMLRLATNALKIDASGFGLELVPQNEYEDVIIDTFEYSTLEGKYGNTSDNIVSVAKVNNVYYALVSINYKYNTQYYVYGRLYSATNIRGPWNCLTQTTADGLTNWFKINNSIGNSRCLRTVGDYLCTSGYTYIPGLTGGYSNNLYIFTNYTSSPVTINDSSPNGSPRYPGTTLSYIDGKYIYYKIPASASSSSGSTMCVYGNSLNNMSYVSNANATGYVQTSTIFKANNHYYMVGHRYDSDLEQDIYVFLSALDPINGPWSVCSGVNAPSESYNCLTEQVFDKCLYAGTFKYTFNGYSVTRDKIIDNVPQTYTIMTHNLLNQVINGTRVFMYKAYHALDVTYSPNAEDLYYGYCPGGSVANITVPGSGNRYIRVLK